MQILISNDDGIFAPGLAALVRAFAAAGHTVYVAAPDSQRSAERIDVRMRPSSQCRQNSWAGPISTE